MLRRVLPLLSLALLCACPPDPAPTSAPTDTSTTQPPAQPDTAGWTGIVDEASFKAMHTLRTDHAPAPRGTMVPLGSAKAYLSLPEGATAPLPAVVVVHEWWGLNEHIQHFADRLAADGYAALAVDLYGGRVATTPDEAMAAMKAVDPAAAQAVLDAAHRFLADDPRVAAQRRGVIGWCFGGAWALRQAIAHPDLDAAVIYYGRLETDPAQLAKIHAPLLGVFANADKSIPPEAVDAFVAALGQAGRAIELHRYDADHAFANPSGAHYDEAAAADAWSHVRRFLATHLRR